MNIIAKLFGSDRGGRMIVARGEPIISAAASTSVSQPDPWLRNIGFGGSRVRSLPPVTPDIAQRHATVFSCCNVIAGDLSKVPLIVMQRQKNGRAVQVFDHAVDYLLNVEAAPGIPAMNARFALGYSFCLRGRAFAYTPRDGGGELTMIDGIDLRQVQDYASGRGRVYDFTDGAGVQRRVTGRTMLHLRYLALDGWTGRSPLEVASESVGLALAGQEAAAKASSGVQMRGYLKMADTFTDDETYMRNSKRVRAALDDPAANGIPIIGADDEIKSLDLSAADQELLASRKYDREQLAAIYRVPPSKLQMLEFGVKANGQQQAIDYKTDCLTHWGGFIETQFSQGVLTEGERRDGLYLTHDYDALLEATTKERYEANAKAVGGPWMTWQEVREREGLPDLKEGQAPYPPSNMTRDESKQGAEDE